MHEGPLPVNNANAPTRLTHKATVGPDVDAFFFEFNMIFHGPADAFEQLLRSALSLPSRPAFCHMLGFDSADPEV